MVGESGTEQKIQKPVSREKERRIMEKRKSRIWILTAAAVVALSAAAAAQEEAVGEDYAVCTVNGEEVYDSAFTETHQYYEETFAAAGYDTESQEIEAYLQECVWDAVIDDVLMRQGLEEEGYFDSADGEEAFSEAFEQFQEELKSQIAFDEEEVRAYYDELVEKDKENYSDNISTYEYVKYYTSTDLWYVPEGYRQILQIVLDGDDEELEEKENEIYERAEAGEDFRELVKEYTIDETATEEEVLEQGYYIHQDSVVWSQEMIQAAFSDEMEEPGDLTTFTDDSGVHILYYAGDLESGPAVEYTDDAAEYVLEKMEDEKLQELSDEYLDGLYSQSVILQTADPSYLNSEEAEEETRTEDITEEEPAAESAKEDSE